MENKEVMNTKVFIIMLLLVVVLALGGVLVYLKFDRDKSTEESMLYETLIEATEKMYVDYANGVGDASELFSGDTKAYPEVDLAVEAIKSYYISNGLSDDESDEKVEEYLANSAVKNQKFYPILMLASKIYEEDEDKINRDNGEKISQYIKKALIEKGIKEENLAKYEKIFNLFDIFDLLKTGFVDNAKDNVDNISNKLQEQILGAYDGKVLTGSEVIAAAKQYENSDSISVKIYVSDNVVFQTGKYAVKVAENLVASSPKAGGIKVTPKDSSYTQLSASEKSSISDITGTNGVLVTQT